jgi:muramidase (phage lysozyme)
MVNDVNVQNKNVQAFLNVIGKFESNNDYHRLVGGGTAQNLSMHPFDPITGRKKVMLKIVDKKTGTYKMVPTTAAGRFQIIFPTYKRLAEKLNIKDFSEASQDRIAIELLAERGVYDDVIAGRLNDALTGASKEWASLPYSTAGQNPVSLNNVRKQYELNGGTYA